MLEIPFADELNLSNFMPIGPDNKKQAHLSEIYVTSILSRNSAAFSSSVELH